MNSTDLAAFISENAIEAEVLHLNAPTLTVASAAEALGVRPEQIVKSVLFLAEGQPLLVITNGLSRIQRKRLADELAMSRRQVKMANQEQVMAITGYPVGAVPPFGHPHPLQTLIDAGVLDQAVVYGGGGETDALMRLRSKELQHATRGRIVSVSEE